MLESIENILVVMWWIGLFIISTIDVSILYNYAIDKNDKKKKTEFGI